MPKESSEQMIMEVNNEVETVSRRLALLQRKADEVEAEMNKRDEAWQKNMELFDYQVGLLRKTIDEMQDTFKKQKNIILRVIGVFRNCAKKSNFDEFKKKVDNLNFEKLVTKRQFKRLLND